MLSGSVAMSAYLRWPGTSKEIAPVQWSARQGFQRLWWRWVTIL